MVVEGEVEVEAPESQGPSPPQRPRPDGASSKVPAPPADAAGPSASIRAPQAPLGAASPQGTFRAGKFHARGAGNAQSAATASQLPPLHQRIEIPEDLDRAVHGRLKDHDTAQVGVVSSLAYDRWRAAVSARITAESIGATPRFASATLLAQQRLSEIRQLADVLPRPNPVCSALVFGLMQEICSGMLPVDATLRKVLDKLLAVLDGALYAPQEKESEVAEAPIPSVRERRAQSLIVQGLDVEQHLRRLTYHDIAVRQRAEVETLRQDLHRLPLLWKQLTDIKQKAFDAFMSFGKVWQQPEMLLVMYAWRRYVQINRRYQSKVYRMLPQISMTLLRKTLQQWFLYLQSAKTDQAEAILRRSHDDLAQLKVDLTAFQGERGFDEPFGEEGVPGAKSGAVRGEELQQYLSVVKPRLLMTLVEDLLDQIMFASLIQRPVCNPGMLLRDDEGLDELGRVEAPTLLLRWANLHLKDVVVRGSAVSTLNELISNPNHISLLLRVVARDVVDLSETDSEVHRWAAVHELGVKLLGEGCVLEGPQSIVSLLASVFLQFPHLQCLPGCALGRNFELIQEYSAEWEKTLIQMYADQDEDGNFQVPETKVLRGCRRATLDELNLPGDKVDDALIDRTSVVQKFYGRVFDNFTQLSNAVSYLRESAQTLSQIRGSVANLAVGASRSTPSLGPNTMSDVSVASCMSSHDFAKQFPQNVRDTFVANAFIVEDAFHKWSRGQPALISFSGFLGMCYDCKLPELCPSGEIWSRRDFESHFHVALAAVNGGSEGHNAGVDLDLQAFLHVLNGLADSIFDQEEAEEPLSPGTLQTRQMRRSSGISIASRLCRFLFEVIKPALELGAGERWPQSEVSQNPFLGLAHSSQVRFTIRRNQQNVRSAFNAYATFDGGAGKSSGAPIGGTSVPQGRISISDIVDALRTAGVAADNVDAKDDDDGEDVLSAGEIIRIVKQAVPTANEPGDKYKLSFFEFVDAIIGVALVRDPDPLTHAATKVGSLVLQFRTECFGYSKGYKDQKDKQGAKRAKTSIF